MGVYPVTLSLLARLSLFGVDLGWGASCDDRTRANAKATKTRDTWGKKERLASGCWRAFLSLSRVVTPAPVEAGGLRKRSHKPMKTRALWRMQFSNWTHEWPLLAA